MADKMEVDASIMFNAQNGFVVVDRACRFITATMLGVLKQSAGSFGLGQCH